MLTDGTATVEVCGSGTNTYLWYNGATTSTITPICLETPVSVTVTNSDGYSATAYATIDHRVGCRVAGKDTASESAANGNVNLYPNPTTGNVTVSYTINSSKGILQLYDVIGNEVSAYQLDGSSNVFEFNASYLCCGIFEYRVTDDNAIIGRGKLVLIR